MEVQYITTRWPVFRTNPAGIATASSAAIGTAIAAVLLLGPLVGAIIIFVEGFIDHPGDVAMAVQTVGILLMVSFFVSWAALIVAVPAALACATHGFAGWGVAVLGGLVIGTLTNLVLEGRLSLGPWAAMTATAVILAGICWLSVRLFHPAFIGIATSQSTTNRT